MNCHHTNILVNMFAFALTLCLNCALQHLRMHLSSRAAGHCPTASQQDPSDKREYRRSSAEWLGHRVESRLRRSLPALSTHWNHRLSYKCAQPKHPRHVFSINAAAVVFVSFSHGDDLIVTPFAQVSQHQLFLLWILHYLWNIQIDGLYFVLMF